MKNDLTKKYVVHIDDNFDFGHEGGGGYKYASFDILEDAIDLCRAILNQELADTHTLGMTAGELSATWAMFGDDPWISGNYLDPIPFSGREYVTEEKCQDIINGKMRSSSWLKRILNFFMSFRPFGESIAYTSSIYSRLMERIFYFLGR